MRLPKIAPSSVARVLDGASTLFLLLAASSFGAACGGAAAPAPHPSAGAASSATAIAAPAAAVAPKSWRERCAFTKPIPPYAGNPSTAPTPPARVTVTDTEVKIGEKIQFATDSAAILPVSESLLAEVADALKANPDVSIVEVDGNADRRGTDAANVDLTQRRAQAVVAKLVALGVDTARLRAVGLGAYCPIDPADNDKAYETNRRVEFHILRRGARDVAPWGGCPLAQQRGIKPPQLPPLPSTPATAGSPSPASAASCAISLDVSGVAPLPPRPLGTLALWPGPIPGDWSAARKGRADIQGQIDYRTKKACEGVPQIKNGDWEWVVDIDDAADQWMNLSRVLPNGGPEQAAARQHAVALYTQALHEASRPGNGMATIDAHNVMNDAHHGIATAYIESGRYDDAERECDASDAIGDRDAPGNAAYISTRSLRSWIALARFDDSKDPKWLDAAEAMLRQDGITVPAPADQGIKSLPWNQRIPVARILERRGQHDAAIAAYRSALEDVPCDTLDDDYFLAIIPDEAR